MKGEKLGVSNLYLTFSISKRYNNLTKDLSQWTSKQEEIHSLIKSLQNKGMGFRKISHYFNSKKSKQEEILIGLIQKFILILKDIKKG